MKKRYSNIKNTFILQNVIDFGNDFKVACDQNNYFLFMGRVCKEKGIDLQNALKTHGTSEPLWKIGCGVWATANVSALDLRIIYIGGKKDE